MNVKNQLTLNELKILSVLNNKDCYGLEIVKKLSVENNSFPLGTLYNTLGNLEKKKRIESYKLNKEVHLNLKGNTRTYYKLTETGKTVLNNHIKLFTQLWGISNSGRFYIGIDDASIL